jgi:hypothetical protein
MDPFLDYAASQYSLAALVALAAAHNHGVACRIWTTGTAFGLTVWINWVTTTGSFTFTTTMWVIDRVHSHTTYGWALALPTHTASFTPVDV